MAAVRRDLEQIVNLPTGPIFANALGKPLALGSAVNRSILQTLKRCEACGKAECWSMSVNASRVENRRSGFNLPVAVGMLSHDPPQSGLAWPCFLFPLIEPDWQISRIRLSEKTHAVAHGRLAVRCGNWTKPNTECRAASGKRW